MSEWRGPEPLTDEKAEMYRKAAKEKYDNDDTTIDPDAEVTEIDGHCAWVAAWVWVQT